MPPTPGALGVSSAPLGHPEALGTTRTVRPRAHTAVTLLTPKPPWTQRAPLALASDVGASFHPDEARDAHLAEEGQQGHVSPTPIGRDDDAACAHGLAYTPPRTADDRQGVAFHTSVEHRGVLGAPGQRDSAPAHTEGDHQPMRVRCHRPVNRPSHFAVLGSLMQGLSQHGIRQQPRSKPLMMQPTGYAVARGCLLAHRACQLGLPGALWLNDRRDEGAAGFALMTVCPGQDKRDIIA